MSADVTSYATAVRAALSDLPAEQRDDLLEDLEGHLLEVTEDGDLRERLGPPEGYAAELRVSAGLDAPREDVGWGGVVRGRLDALLHRAQRHPLASGAIALAPDLRPGWWVLRAWLAVLVLGAWTADNGRYGLGHFPVPSVYDSVLLGPAALLAAVVVSVRLGRRSVSLPKRRRQLVAAANAAIVLAALVLAGDVRGSVYGSNDYYYASSASQTEVLTGPNGPISNIYPFDSLGRPLRDVQLFDQWGNPIGSLLREDTEGRYAEPEPRFGVDGLPKPHVFPRSYRVDDYDPAGFPTTRPVPPPSIAPQPLQPRPTPSPSVSPSVSPSASPSAEASPSAAPPPTG